MRSERDYDIFERYLVDIVKLIRETLATTDDISYMAFEIKVDGRVNDGDLLIEYKLGGYGNNAAIGGNLREVVAEYLHRQGWSKRNQALCLPKADPDSIKDEGVSPF